MMTTNGRGRFDHNPGPRPGVTRRLRSLLRSSPLAQNASWVLGAQGVRTAFQAATFILIARALGVEGFGAFAAAIALATIVSPFAGWGIGNIIVQRAAHAPSSVPTYWGNALIIITVTGSLLVAALVAIRALFFPSLPLILFVAVGISELVNTKLAETAGRVFQALDRLRVTSVLLGGSYILRFAAIVVAVLPSGPTSPARIAVAYLAASTVAALVSVAAVRKAAVHASPRPHLIPSNLADGFYFSLSLSAHMSTAHIDKTMLARIDTFQSAGIYTAAYRLVDLAFRPMLSLFIATYLRFFKEGANGVGEAYRFAKRLATPTLGYGMFMGIALWVAAPAVPVVLGTGYAEAVTIVRWLALVPLLQVLYHLPGDVLTGAGHQRLRSLIETGVAVQNGVLNLSLIPILSWRGAVASTLLSHITLAAALWYAVLRLRESERRVLAEPRPGSAPRASTAVCIGTCRRPDLLRRTLASVADLRFRKVPVPDLSVVVVDNDPYGSASEVCRDAASRMLFPLTYEVEPQPGIPAVRNRAIRAAGDVDFVAFVDDDETVDPWWLDELLDTQHRFDAPAVGGPVLAEFAGFLAPWIERGAFFDRPRFLTGSVWPLDLATGNLLLHTSVIEDVDGPFDERFGLNGGDDTHLSRTLAQRGVRYVWADGAIVTETIPPSRTTARYLLRRAYRDGNGRALSYRMLPADAPWWLSRLAAALLHIGKGTLILPVAALRGRAGLIRALCEVAQGFGGMAGLRGSVFEQYRDRHPPVAERDLDQAVEHADERV